MENGTVQNQPMVDAAQTSTQNYAPPQGRMMSQDEVNYLTSKVRADGYEQGKRDGAQSASQIHPPAQPVISPEEIEAKLESMLETKLRAKQDDLYINNMMHTHRQNLASGQQKYGKDFDDSVGSINFQALPQLVPLINSLPNGDDVMYELGKDENEDRFDKITSHLVKGQFVKAERAMKKFSESLASNNGAAEKAKYQPNVPEPMNSVRPSTASAGTTKPSTYAEISAAIDAKRFRK